MSLLHADFTSSDLDPGVGVVGHTEFCFEFPEELHAVFHSGLHPHPAPGSCCHVLLTLAALSHLDSSNLLGSGDISGLGAVFSDGWWSIPSKHGWLFKCLFQSSLCKLITCIY